MLGLAVWRLRPTGITESTPGDTSDATDLNQRVFIRGDNALDGAELNQQTIPQCRTNPGQALKSDDAASALAHLGTTYHPPGTINEGPFQGRLEF